MGTRVKANKRLAGKAEKEIEAVRKTVADFLGANPREIYFTGGGSESDNWALKATAFAKREQGKHIITSKIEHHAILHTCEYLEKLGFEVTYVDVEELHIDILSASGHKINGPKGIGIMYLSESVKIGAFIHGGSQERSRRAGTHNTPGIVGFGKATELAAVRMKERCEYETKLRDYLIDQVLEKIPYTKLNGHRTNRLSNNANFSFHSVEGESLLILLDQKGICGSSGSACTSGALDPSHVLLAIGLSHEIAHGSLRLTLSEETTKEEIDYVIEQLVQIVNRLRSMSPLYEDFVKTQNA